MTTATCRFCGREFTASRTGSTVHCPAHRTRESRKTSRDVPVVGYDRRPHAGLTCTVRFATTGACGKPAVFAFMSRDGEIFAECAEHYEGERR